MNCGDDFRDDYGNDFIEIALKKQLYKDNYRNDLEIAYK